MASPLPDLTVPYLLPYLPLPFNLTFTTADTLPCVWKETPCLTYLIQFGSPIALLTYTHLPFPCLAVRKFGSVGRADNRIALPFVPVPATDIHGLLFGSLSISFYYLLDRTLPTPEL